MPMVLTARGKRSAFSILEARAAIVAPTGGEPGYYVIIGQELKALSNGKRPLLFLAEGKSDNQRELLKLLSDDAGRLNVRRIYALENTGFFKLLWETFKDVNTVKVMPAPFPADVDFGLALIKEWMQDKAITIPETRIQPTEIRRHLESATEASTGSIVDALRYLVGAFFHYKPQRPVTTAHTAPSNFYWG